MYRIVDLSSNLSIDEMEITNIQSLQHAKMHCIKHYLTSHLKGRGYIPKPTTVVKHSKTFVIVFQVDNNQC